MGFSEEVRRDYSTAEVARILGMREQRIRELARLGLCRPERRGRAYAFSFRDLVALRTAKGLAEQPLPAARVQRVLRNLAEQLPEDRALAALRIRVRGGEVAVTDDRTVWNPETGQALLSFESTGLPEGTFLPDRIDAPSAPGGPDSQRTARMEFERGVDLEEDDPTAACHAYMTALKLDPTGVDAYVNLGRLLQEAGDPQEAIRLYQRALEVAPREPVLHFNLALAYEDIQALEPAIEHYQRALRIDSDFADAHYNLAALLELMGRLTDALRHHAAYRRLIDD